MNFHIFIWALKTRETRQIRVSLLTGKDEWVFLDWIPFERLNERKLNECETVETIFNGLDVRARDQASSYRR